MLFSLYSITENSELHLTQALSLPILPIDYVLPRRYLEQYFFRIK